MTTREAAEKIFILRKKEVNSSMSASEEMIESIMGIIEGVEKTCEWVDDPENTSYSVRGCVGDIKMNERRSYTYCPYCGGKIITKEKPDDDS